MNRSPLLWMELLEGRTPPVPVTLAPGSDVSPGDSLVSLTPTFTWQASSGATRYGLYIRDLSTNTLIFSNSNLTGTSYRVASGLLKNARAYRWNMSAFNSSGQQSATSTLRHFQTDQPRLEGIDVSRWQLTINWNQVRNTAGKQFVFMKASEASNVVDPNFNVNRTNALAAGMIVGFYHRVRPLTNDALTEANHFVATMGQHLVPGRMRPVMDFEDGHELGKTALSAWGRTFLNRVQQLTGQRPIIYANTWYASTYFDTDLRNYDLWIANWGQEIPNGNPPTGIWADWNFWQYSSTGRISGISTDVDLNYFAGTREQLLRQFVIQPAKGDMNGDGQVNNLDIAPFVQALTSESAYRASYPFFAPEVIGDINNDGVLNNLDIAGFVSLLTSTRPATSVAPAPTPTRAPTRIPLRDPTASPLRSPTVLSHDRPIAGALFADTAIAAPDPLQLR